MISPRSTFIVIGKRNRNEAGLTSVHPREPGQLLRDSWLVICLGVRRVALINGSAEMISRADSRQNDGNYI